MGKCAKCNKEINHNAGFYNFPTGAMCAKCGKERSQRVSKAIDQEIKRMARELKYEKRIK